MAASAVHNLAHQHASATALELAHDGLPTRICFGAGASGAHLRTELDRLGARHIRVVSSRTHTDALRRIVACLTEHGIHTTIVDAYAEEDLEGSLIAADGATLVAVGGNTITGRAKQAAAQLDVPLVVVPTTYSGAELDTRLPRHTTAGFRFRRVPPAAVIYDPCLVRTLPARHVGLSLLAATGNALRATTEAPDGSLAQLLAGQGLCQLSRAALDIFFNPASMRGPTAAQFGAYLTGTAAALSPMAAPMDAALTDTADGERFQLARAALVRQTARNHPRLLDAHAPRARALEGVDIEAFVEQLIQAAGLTADLPTTHLC